MTVAIATMYPLSIRLWHHSELYPLAQFMNRLLVEQHMAYNVKRDGIAKKHFLQLDTYSIILYIYYYIFTIHTRVKAQSHQNLLRSMSQRMRNVDVFVDYTWCYRRSE